MRALLLASVMATGCATGVLAAGDDTATHHDAGGVQSKGTDAGPSTGTSDSGFTPPSQDDSGGTNTNTCSGTMCGAVCVDTTSDSSNCGSCGNACPTSATCVSSVCTCSSGTLCGGSCVDTQTDNANCGKCGTTCTTSQTCTAGVCTATSTAPPQGTCGHSLCATGSYLSDTCDTDGCTYEICDIVGDSYCCSGSWDSTCVGEVTTYCSPYSCP